MTEHRTLVLRAASSLHAAFHADRLASVDRPGVIDFTEAASEIIVPNGQLVSLGGATSSMHEVTRQILGYRNRSSSDESHLQVSATIQ